MLKWLLGVLHIQRAGALLAPGTVAPPFEVRDHEGRTVRLSDFAGRRVVLWFYPKADTPGCTLEGCGFRDRIRAYEAAGAAVLGISFDTQAENKAFAEKFGYTFPLLCDTDRKVGLAYGACASAKERFAARVTYVIGTDGRIEQAMLTRDPKGQAEALLPSLQSRPASSQ